MRGPVYLFQGDIMSGNSWIARPDTTYFRNLLFMGDERKNKQLPPVREEISRQQNCWSLLSLQWPEL